MPAAPLVSIIVASYNYAHWLPQALQSALEQQCADFELLVVDDGSTDASLAVAQGFAARDGRVRLLSHADGGNHGLPATLALGLAAARGRWTAFLEADDVWLPDNLSRRLAAAAQTDAGAVFNDVELWPMPGAATGWFTGYVPRVMAGHARRGRDGQRAFSLCGPMLLENVIPTFSCAMVRTELLRACDWQSPVPRWTDWWLWCQLACRTRFFFLPHKLVRWRLHASSQHHGVRGSYLRDYARMGRGLARLLGPELTARGRRRWLWYLRLPAPLRLAVRLGRMALYQGLGTSLRQVWSRLRPAGGSGS